ncbi:hypothetical protein BC938DRAFT_483942 [Jimgerdemannia flammicorona]|uniref:DNA-directed DNA polymerase n=1 Tax=Jimgerdemannia flammicorona TaxID=994334 RepID=A0A433R059_9FUNG|nr:hypothetical protein BC938DRAFT_483942 [Jimgerdemannia flammicorona]
MPQPTITLNAVKKELKDEGDALKRAILDARQQAMKLCANSLYELTGVAGGKLASLAVATSVTASGQGMIKRAKSMIEFTFTITKGEKHDAQVVYGDTDSVMVNFGPISVADTIELSKRAAGLLSNIPGHRETLNFEWAFMPFLLVGKKCYAGLTGVNNSLVIKGIQTVKHDTSEYIATTVERCLEILFASPQGGLDAMTMHIKDKIWVLLQDELDPAVFAITKQWNASLVSMAPGRHAPGLTNGTGPRQRIMKAMSSKIQLLLQADVQQQQPHIAATIRSRLVDAPECGDHVTYVITAKAGGDKMYKQQGCTAPECARGLSADRSGLLPPEFDTTTADDVLTRVWW